jgi:photosystem II stability/assembly factor-like uncharacterized protein
VNWTRRTSGGNDLHDVTYGNGLFVAVGQNGTILTSPDGARWTARASGADNFLSGVTYGNGLFVAVGVAVRSSSSWLSGWLPGPTMLTSPDGVTWTEQTSPTNNELKDVTYGNGLFVAVGEDGTILTSRDGVDWTEQISPTNNSFLSVTYGNGRFVAVGIYGTILTSP